MPTFFYIARDRTGNKITSTEEAKKMIWGAIGGLLLGLSAYLILNTINPDLTLLRSPLLLAY